MELDFEDDGGRSTRTVLKWSSVVLSSISIIMCVVVFTILIVVNSCAYLDSSRPSIRARTVSNPFPQAMEAFNRQDYKTAENLFLQVSPYDRNYSKAMRYTGFHIYLRAWNLSPLKGIPLLNAGLLANPFDGNQWADITSAYLASVQQVIIMVMTHNNVMGLHPLATMQSSEFKGS